MLGFVAVLIVSGVDGMFHKLRCGNRFIKENPFLVIMQTLECIRTRRSVRKFLDKPVEFENLGNVLDAGRLAPSAGNIQDWKFILVTDGAKREELANACAQQVWMANAPAHIVVCADKKSERLYGERGEKIYLIQNSAAAVENMLLAAHDQGLGACWVSAFDEEMVRRALVIPSDVIPQAVVVLGYADEKPEFPSKFTLEEVTYVEKWGARIKDMEAFLGYYYKNVMKIADVGKTTLKRILEKLKPK